MTPEEIKQYRDDYFNALVEITRFDQMNMPKDKLVELYREKAYGLKDSAIEAMARETTPREAAEFETM